MSAPLAGCRVIVSAGPTFEDLDPVRFLGNRSSGKMGFAVAAAAMRAGAEVVLVAGPVQLPTPEGVTRVDVRSAAQMHAAVFAALPADIYVGAAAVADFTPQQVALHKIKKVPGDDGLTLRLVRTADLLADIAHDTRRPRLVVGFAAETENVDANADAKRIAKGVDLIAANRVGAAGSGFESDDNLLVVHGVDGSRQFGPGPKTDIAIDLVALLVDRLADHLATEPRP